MPLLSSVYCVAEFSTNVAEPELCGYAAVHVESFSAGDELVLTEYPPILSIVIRTQRELRASYPM